MPTRQLVTAASLALCLFLATSLSAATHGGAQCTEPVSVLKAYVAEKYGEATPEKPVVVLAFDHQTQDWIGYSWDGKDMPELQPDSELKIPFTNEPRVFLKKERREKLVVLVYNTNPLLYSTTLTDVTEADIEDLEELQKLATLLGGVISAGVRAAAPEVRLLAEDPGLRGLRGTDRGLWEDANKLRNALNAETKEITDKLEALQSPWNDFAQQVAELAEATSEMKSYLQLVENDTLIKVGNRRFENLEEEEVTPSTLDGAASEIASKRSKLANARPECVVALTALRDAVQLYRMPLPKDGGKKKLARDEYAKNKASLEALKPCESSKSCKAPRLCELIVRLSDYLHPLTDDGTSGDEDDILRALIEGLDGFLTIVGTRREALKLATELLTKSDEAVRDAEAAHAFLERRREALVECDGALTECNPSCFLRTGVIEVKRHENPIEKLPWTRVGTTEFQLVADSPFKDDILLRHPEELSASYQIQRAWRWNFDLDVATIYSEVTSPVFEKVTGPNEETEKEDDTAEFIRQTDEEGRAGELAVFLSLPWRSRDPKAQRFSIGPQFGAGVSTDDPAFFLGLGLGLGRYVKLGAGWTWQQVKELDGQKANQMLDTGETIRLRDGFDDGFYASLSIAIDELPFFKAQ